MRRSLAVRAAILLLVFLSGLPIAFAQEGSSTAQIRAVRPFAIRELGFFGTAAPVQILREESPDQQMIATLSGRYVRQDWNLVGPDGSPLPPRFSLHVTLTAENTPVHFTAVGPTGATEEATIVIVEPNYISASEGSNEIPSLGDSWDLGLGMSSISYSQTNTQGPFSALSEIVLTPKLYYQHSLSNRWDLGGNMFVTALPISTSPSGISATFIGVNARAGYQLPFVPKPWTFSVGLGIYYTTMSTSGATFGYRNMIGPQLFPSIRRSIGDKNMLGIYFKYSPVTEPGAFGFTSHELATGISFTHLLPGRHSFSLALDYSDITVQANSVVATTSAVTGGLAYGF